MNKNDFTEKVLSMERSMYRIAISYLINDADACDAAQEAILIAWNKLHTLKEEKYFKTWLIRILINVCKQMLKKRKREKLQGDLTLVQQPCDIQDLDLYMAIQALDRNIRIVLILYYLENYSIKEIAQLLKIPQGTVKSRLFNARNSLKGILEEMDYEK